MTQPIALNETRGQEPPYKEFTKLLVKLVGDETARAVLGNSEVIPEQLRKLELEAVYGKAKAQASHLHPEATDDELHTFVVAAEETSATVVSFRELYSFWADLHGSGKSRYVIASEARRYLPDPS